MPGTPTLILYFPIIISMLQLIFTAVNGLLLFWLLGRYSQFQREVNRFFQELQQLLKRLKEKKQDVYLNLHSKLMYFRQHAMGNNLSMVFKTQTCTQLKTADSYMKTMISLMYSCILKIYVLMRRQSYLSATQNKVCCKMCNAKITPKPLVPLEPSVSKNFVCSGNKNC